MHEVKKSKAIEEAGIWQVKYYLYYLEERGVSELKAKIDYPLIKENRTVELTEEDRIRLREIIEKIYEIQDMEQPPDSRERKICRKCACQDLCLI